MNTNTLLETLDTRINHNAALARGIERHLNLRRNVTDKDTANVLRRGLETFQAVVRELTEIRTELTR